MNTIFSKFTPQEPKFFPIFNELADVLIEAADKLVLFISNYAVDTSADHFKGIKELEKKADTLSNKVFDELDKTFITPFDREDVYQLANRMDDVMDGITSAAKKIMLYRPDKLHREAISMALLIKECTLTISKAIDELDVMKKDQKHVMAYCSELHDLENKADDVYEQYIIELFETAENGMEVIRHKGIMVELERTTDMAEQVGKILKTIIVKHA